MFFEQYIGFYSNRLSRKGGGACILINKKLNCQLIEILNLNTGFVEAVFVEIHSNNNKVIVGSGYRTPNTNFDAFVNFIENELQPMTSNSSDLNVCDDFNLIC